jgi:hypothetical protein
MTSARLFSAYSCAGKTCNRSGDRWLTAPERMKDEPEKSGSHSSFILSKEPVRSRSNQADTFLLKNRRKVKRPVMPIPSIDQEAGSGTDAYESMTVPETVPLLVTKELPVDVTSACAAVMDRGTTNVNSMIANPKC